MQQVNYKVFDTTSMEWTHSKMREKRREEALAFMNDIGADRVISVIELEGGGGAGNFSVVVWYREK